MHDRKNTGLRRGADKEPEARASLPRVRSSRLFGASPCVVIEHGAEEYRLRITRLGKLILTK